MRLSWNHPNTVLPTPPQPVRPQNVGKQAGFVASCQLVKASDRPKQVESKATATAHLVANVRCYDSAGNLKWNEKADLGEV